MGRVRSDLGEAMFVSWVANLRSWGFLYHGSAFARL